MKICAVRESFMGESRGQSNHLQNQDGQTLIRTPIPVHRLELSQDQNLHLRVNRALMMGVDEWCDR